MSFLIDTDTCSAYLKGDHRVAHRFVQYGGRLHVSAITVGQLFTWALQRGAASTRAQGLTDLLRDVTFLDVNFEISRKFGELRSLQRQTGKLAPDMDLLIAATALVHDLTLVTHNVKHFAHITDLSVQDWLAP